MMEWGDLLTYIRIREGLTRPQLKDITGLDAAALCEYETNTREPRWSRAMQILDSLGYRMSIVKKGDDEKERYF